MPVDARRLIRKMRGGAQAHLLEASDGHCYVVKFLNNPQHQRILVNEWLSSVFLQYLGIATPPCAMIRISPDFLAANSETYIQLGSERRAVPPGWHFGSRYPGDPRRNVVYDFLPDSLLERVENAADFRAALVFDKWMGNTDSRQAIFFRARVHDAQQAAPPPVPSEERTGREGGPPRREDPASHIPPSRSIVREKNPEERLGFVAQMMDNGYVFEGPQWRFSDSPLYGLYFRKTFYRAVRGWADFEPWLERIQYFPEAVVDEGLKQIPEEWLADSSGASRRAELEHLLERLLRRRKRVASLIEDCRGSKSEPFPNWR